MYNASQHKRSIHTYLTYNVFQFRCTAFSV